MCFNRRCIDCGFRGIDIEFFTRNKKVCDSCLQKKDQKKEFRKIESKNKRREYIRDYSKKYRKNNKEYFKSYSAKWRQENPEKVKEYYDKSYEKNKESIKKAVKIRRDIDPLFKLKMNLRNLIKNSLTRQGYTKRSKTYSIIGITYEDFKIYIENKFTDGMSWDNYGSWHLDHIIPISSAKSEEEAINLCFYENFQPLWASDNRNKSDKIFIE